MPLWGTGLRVKPSLNSLTYGSNTEIALFPVLPLLCGWEKGPKETRSPVTALLHPGWEVHASPQPQKVSATLRASGGGSHLSLVTTVEEWSGREASFTLWRHLFAWWIFLSSAIPRAKQCDWYGVVQSEFNITEVKCFLKRLVLKQFSKADITMLTSVKLHWLHHLRIVPRLGRAFIFKF